MSELENRVHAGELAARASSVGCACGVRTCCRRRRRRPRLLQKPQHPHSRRHINTHTQKRLQQIRAARGESLGLFFWGGGGCAPATRALNLGTFPHTQNKQTKVAVPLAAAGDCLAALSREMYDGVRPAYEGFRTPLLLRFVAGVPSLCLLLACLRRARSTTVFVPLKQQHTTTTHKI